MVGVHNLESKSINSHEAANFTPPQRSLLLLPKCNRLGEKSRVERLTQLGKHEMNTTTRHATNTNGNPYGDLATLRERFPEASDPTMGLEIEAPMLNPKTGQPMPLFERIRGELPTEWHARIHPEFGQWQIEYATKPHLRIHTLRQEITEFVKETERLCRKHGGRLAWQAVMPNWSLDPKLITDTERSWMNLKRYGGRAAYLAMCSMHVHVGVSRDMAIPVADRMQSFVPLLIAIAANSPQMAGRNESACSHRAAIWSNEFETSGFPRRFGDWDGFELHVSQLQKANIIASQKDLYYFIRPTRFGTIEVRCCDLPPDLDTAIEITALIQTLAVAVQTKPELEIATSVLHADLISAVQNGPTAKLTNWRGHRVDLLNLLDDLCGAIHETAVTLGTERELASLFARVSRRQKVASERNQPAILRTESTRPRNGSWAVVPMTFAAGLLAGLSPYLW